MEIAGTVGFGKKQAWRTVDFPTAGNILLVNVKARNNTSGHMPVREKTISRHGSAIIALREGATMRTPNNPYYHQIRRAENRIAAREVVRLLVVLAACVIAIFVLTRP